MEHHELTLDLVRLRRVRRRHPNDEDLRAVQTSLESAAGPTVGRAAAARVLGLSQTALDRWVRAGDVPVVMTPTGRWEIPLRPLVELIEAVEERRGMGSRRPLSAVLRSRRKVAAAEPRARGPARGHDVAESRGRAYHRRIADRLDDTMVADARERTRRWREEGRIHPRYAEAWEQLLRGPRASLLHTLRADDEHAAALRQSSPFAGMLDERERRALLGINDGPAI